MNNFKLSHLTKYVLWVYTLLAVLVKSVLILGFTNSTNNVRFDFTRIFYFSPIITVYISFIVLFISLAFLFKGKVQSWYLIIFNLIITLLMIMDLWYYRAFGTFISVYLLKQTANLDNLSDSIISMMRYTDIFFFIDIVIASAIIFMFKEISKKTQRSIIAFAVFFIVSLSYITYMHFRIDIWHQGVGCTQLFKTCWAPYQTYSNLSPIGYHIYDAYSYNKDSKPLVLSDKDKNEIKSWFESKKENLPDNKYKSMLKGKNLIVIQVESLENFVINQKVNGQEVTPNLNKLLKNSLYFNNYNEQVYNGTSSDADLMTNTSVYPVRKGSTFFRYPYNTYKSLPLLMEAQGYSTIAVHPDKGSYWNWMPALKSIGFQKCIDASYFNQDETIGLGISDGSYLKQVAPVAAKEKQPFYMFMVTLTSHAPFDLPEQYRELKLDKELDSTKLGGYFQSAHYTDKQIGTFIDTLEKDGLMNNTAIVIYGDHCGIHKFYQEEVDSIKSPEDWWLDNHHQIPLIIYQNGIKGETITTTGGEIDLMPTISYLMGVDKSAYENSTMGRNLLNTKKDFAVLADGTYVGNTTNKSDKDNALNGFNIADKIIEGNYFK